MTTDMSKLKPSVRIGAISLDLLRTLPLGGVYVRAWPSHINDTLRVDRVYEKAYDYSLWDEDSGRWENGFECDGSAIPLFYPILPALAFAMTPKQMATPGDQPSGRMKSTTRRVRCPTWAKPGALFNGWDRTFRVGKGLAEGLGTFRVASVEQGGRWRCPHCSAIAYRGRHSGLIRCSKCPRIGGSMSFETLTPRELELEGFPGMGPDEFWSLLNKAGNLDENELCWRISFEAAA